MGLADLTFYRLADAAPSAASISGLMDAIWSVAGATVDYNGVSLPSTHLWTAGREGTTTAVHLTPPTGTMTRNMKLLIAGSTSGSPSMGTPDSFTASAPLMGVSVNSGAYGGSWTSTTPFGASCIFSNFWKIGGTTWNATTAKVRAFVSEETWFIQLINSAGTTQAWAYAGAIIDANASGGRLGTDAESDGRLYGMMVTGGGGSVPASWQNGIPAQGPFQHWTADGGEHMAVFSPGSSTLWTCGRRLVTHNTGSVDSFKYTSGAYGGVDIPINRTSAGRTHDSYLVGSLRGIAFGGRKQSGTVAPASGTTTAHFVSPDTTSGSTADAIRLRAAA